MSGLAGVFAKPQLDEGSSSVQDFAHAFATAPVLANGASTTLAAAAAHTQPLQQHTSQALLPSSLTGGSGQTAGKDFDNMADDLRRVFLAWLMKTESEFVKERDSLSRERKDFENEKQRIWAQFQAEKKRELDRIKDDQRRQQLEMEAQLKQVQAERDDARAKMQEERAAFDQNMLKERAILEAQQAALREEIARFQLDRERIADTVLAAQDMITLNVGGQVFESTRKTLCSQASSFLAGVLSGRVEVARDSQGRVFFDRDGDLFRTILNFLRNPDYPPTPNDAFSSSALSGEAEFYGVRFFPFPLVFALGGSNGFEYLRAMEVLDVNNHCWRPCTPMNCDRIYFGAAAFQGRIYAFGGQNLEYKALCDLEIYDCLRDVWVSGAGLSIPRRNCAAVVAGGRIFAIGGFDGNNILSSVECYDPKLKNWMQVASMSVPRSGAMATTLTRNGREYVCVCGGTSGTRLKSTELYDLQDNVWIPAPDLDMIEVRSAGTALACLDHVYVMGGADNAQNVSTSLECFNPSVENRSWAYRASPAAARMDCSGCTVSDSLLLGGGQSAGSVLDSVEFYKPDEDAWQAGPPMLFPRHGHAVVALNL